MSPSGSGDTLYLFTFSFPYGPGETFLETEIGYLAAAWDRVVVLPATRAGEARPLPPNVLVDGDFAAMLARRAAASTMVRALGDPAIRREMVRSPSLLSKPQYLRRLLGQILVARRSARWIGDNLLRHAGGPALCYSYWLNFAALGLARLRPSRRGITFVTRAHGLDLYAERHDPPYLPLQREVVEAADAVFPVSEHGLRYLGDRHLLPAGSLEVARLGVPDPGGVASASRDGVWRVLSCSGLLSVKRVDRLVQGLAALGGAHPTQLIDWTHLGDGPLRMEVEKQARETLPENVRWRLAGQIPNEAVLAYYDTMPVDLLVNVSASEGVPVSMMEAQSRGVPIVATAVGGVPEIVLPGTGLLLGPDPTPEEIAAAIGHVCGDRGRASGMRAAARANWADRWDAALNYTAFVRRLKELSGRR